MSLSLPPFSSVKYMLIGACFPRDEGFQIIFRFLSVPWPYRHMFPCEDDIHMHFCHIPHQHDKVGDILFVGLFH